MDPGRHEAREALLDSGRASAEEGALMPEILQHPHGALRRECYPVTHFDSTLAWIISQMSLAIDQSPVKALGLAANQIGEFKRVIIVVQGGQKIVMVNPVIKSTQGVQTVRDGCLSVQYGRYFKARARPLSLLVEYQNEKGEQCRRKAKGINAAAIAHEIEHLDGKIFIDALAGEAA
jgi:peptide deformylase